MQIRPAQPDDLKDLAEIDATVHSTDYLHVEQSGEGLAVGWKLELRALRSPLIESNRLSDEASFLLRQVVSGADDGLALVAEHNDLPVALLLARPEPEFGVLRLVDLRVDFDLRRQGLATAMIFMAITAGREQELRAVSAETATNNAPAARLLSKSGFDLCGLDTRHRTNHDLVKESATVLWYAALD